RPAARRRDRGPHRGPDRRTDRRAARVAGRGARDPAQGALREGTPGHWRRWRRPPLTTSLQPRTPTAKPSVTGITGHLVGATESSNSQAPGYSNPCCVALVCWGGNYRRLRTPPVPDRPAGGGPPPPRDAALPARA